MYTSKKFLKEIRPKASVLISYVADSGFTREAWKTYYDWLNEKITYKQALSRLKKLAKHRNRKRGKQDENEGNNEGPPRI